MQKRCSKCKETKDLTQFNKRKASKDGLTARCGDCIRAKGIHTRAKTPDATRGYNLKIRFNISIDDYNHLFLKQRGLCAICRQPESTKDKKGNIKWLAVDHNHHTQEIRGLLCSSCNTGIGLLGDSIDTMTKAIKYLKERGSYGN
jgi:hypothetical protein